MALEFWSRSTAKAGMADRDRLPDTYAGWLASAEQVASEVKRSGVAVERVLIPADDFDGWYGARGSARDSAARSRFANEPRNC